MLGSLLGVLVIGIILGIVLFLGRGGLLSLRRVPALLLVVAILSSYIHLLSEFPISA